MQFCVRTEVSVIQLELRTHSFANVWMAFLGIIVKLVWEHFCANDVSCDDNHILYSMSEVRLGHWW